MAKRESKKVVTGVTEQEFNECMHGYAVADAKLAEKTAKMEQEIIKIREKYGDTLTDLEAEKEEHREKITAYCRENKEVLFAEKRSLHTEHGTVGFRWGTPKLKLLPKWNWEKVLDKVAAVLPEFVRTKSEVNKDSLLDNRNDPAVAPHLNAIGVYVDQDESFFIDLKKEGE